MSWLSAAGGIIGAGVNLYNAQENRDQQKEFAQHGIQWKVADAKAAGVHPLYALGASTHSPAPVSSGDMASSLASVGQNIDRAVYATSSASERITAHNEQVQALQLTRMGLENDLLASQIARLRDNHNPPMPTVGGRKKGGSSDDPDNIGREDKFEDRPRLALGGGEIATDRRTANAEEFEKRYGDEASIVFAPAIMWRDAIANYGPPATWPRQVVDEVWRQAVSELNSEYGNARRAARRIVDFLRNERR